MTSMGANPTAINIAIPSKADANIWLDLACEEALLIFCLIGDV